MFESNKLSYSDPADITFSFLFSMEFVLLVDRWIVTAAHCVSNDSHAKILFGITSNGGSNTVMLVPPSDQYIHPLYKDSTYVHDIGKVLITHCYCKQVRIS